MIDSLIGNLFGVPLMTSLSATGKIKKYQIVVSLIILCIVPFGYLALKLGYDAPSVFYITILFTAISGFVRFLFCRKQIGYSLRLMMRDVLLPIMGMTMIILPLPIFLKLKYFRNETFLDFICSCLLALVITLFAAWFIALKNNERNMIKMIVKSKIHRK